MATYKVKDIPKVTAYFANAAGVAVDPTTVTVMIKTPAGVVTTYVYGVGPAFITKEGVGIYSFSVELLQEKNYFYRIEGTGTNQAPAEGTLSVERSEFY